MLGVESHHFRRFLVEELSSILELPHSVILLLVWYFTIELRYIIGFALLHV